MARIVYIGDEVTAAGFRLAGVETRVTEPGDATDALRQALVGDAECVLLSRTARRIPCRPPCCSRRSRRSSRRSPWCPTSAARGAPPDLVREVRNALGIET